MKYSQLVNIYEQLSSTSKRLEKIEILSKFLTTINEEDKEILYLLMGRIYPEHDERKTGISSQLAIKAISKSTGINDKEVIQEWKSIGDLGKVFEKLSDKKRQSTLHKSILTTEKVLENLKKLSELEGKGTVGRKISLITELLSSASSVEGLYIIRTLIGDLRIGVKESTIKEALALRFFPQQKKEASKKIQDAIDKSNDIVSVFEIVKKGKLDKLENISLEVGKPIKVMLSQKKKTISEAFKSLGKPCAIEYKYDGFRCCTGNTAIYVKKKGLVSIREIKIGEEVLTHKGNFKKVLAINKRKIDNAERLFKIQSFLGNEFRITEKHSLQVYRKNKLQWIPSEMLKKTDELVFPIPRFNEESILKNKLELSNSSGYKKTIPVNKFFFR